ncbi:MAG: hypothetical protein D6B27_06050 [Gammaproteobacteria bacterium]|nr:MAG: hypothetical protein D6B27_06050 [Gammaproteobacteria bacterium]
MDRTFQIFITTAIKAINIAAIFIAAILAIVITALMLLQNNGVALPVMIAAAFMGGVVLLTNIMAALIFNLTKEV